MPLYVVVPLGTNRPELDGKIQELPNESVYPLPNDSGWIIKFPGTTKELCEKFGVPAQKGQPVQNCPTVLAAPLQNYYGYGSSEMWDWVRTRTEA